MQGSGGEVQVGGMVTNGLFMDLVGFHRSLSGSV